MANKRGQTADKHYYRMPRKWPKRYFVNGFSWTMCQGEYPFSERNVRLLLKRDTEARALEALADMEPVEWGNGATPAKCPPG